MKNLLLLSALTISGLILTGCSESKKSSSSSSTETTSNPLVDCTVYPYATECSGSTTGNIGGSTGGATSGPQSTYIPADNNWMALYGNQTSAPQETECAAPTGSGFDLRKGTITLGGGNTYYIPGGDVTFSKRFASPNNVISSPTSMSAYSSNMSYFLATIDEAKNFYATDSKLRVRFKVRPQPVPPVGQTWCYNRQTGQTQDNWGYTLLRYSVSVVGLNKNDTLKTQNGYPIFENTKTVNTNVYTCSNTMDFSGLNQKHPYGLVLAIHDVQTDQACWYSSGCTGYKTLRRASCWQMDVEASVDTTKDI